MLLHSSSVVAKHGLLDGVGDGVGEPDGVAVGVPPAIEKVNVHFLPAAPGSLSGTLGATLVSLNW